MGRTKSHLRSFLGCVGVAGLLVVGGCTGAGDLDVVTPTPGDGAGADQDGGAGTETGVTPTIEIDRDSSGPFELPNEGGTVTVRATVTADEDAQVTGVQAEFRLGTSVAVTTALTSQDGGATYTGQAALPLNGDYTKDQSYTVTASATVGETVVVSGAYTVKVKAPEPPPAPYEP